MHTGDKVTHADYGPGRVVGAFDDGSRVHVQFRNGNKHWFSFGDSRLSPETKKPKVSREQKARILVDELRDIPMVWAVVGFLASHTSRITASAPEHLQTEVSEMLSSYGVSHEIEESLTGKENQISETGEVTGAQGPSFCVVSDNFGMTDAFERVSGVHSSAYQNEGAPITDVDKISIQQWQFVLVLLLGDLKFKLSAKNKPPPVQDFQTIRNLVPGKYLQDFDNGAYGKFTSYALPVDMSV